MDNVSDHLLALELQLLQSAVRTDAATLSSLLTDDFREFGSSGRTYTKSEIGDALATEVLRTLTLHDFVCQSISPETALVTYRSRSEAGEALRSSIWIRKDDRWRMLFHQGTKVPKLDSADAVS